jgi:hypothetical protein
MGTPFSTRKSAFAHGLQIAIFFKIQNLDFKVSKITQKRWIVNDVHYEHAKFQCETPWIPYSAKNGKSDKFYKF